MRKVFAVEYDEQGNEIEKLELGGQEILSEMGYCSNRILIDPLYCLPKAQRELFTKEQWKTIFDYQYPIMCVDIEFWVEFFKMPENQIKLATYLITECPFGSYPTNEFHRYLGHSIVNIKMALQIVKDIVGISGGLYIAVTNNGKWWYTYPNGITRKQAKYQESKGRRIIFLSFKDFKEYAVSINELQED